MRSITSQKATSLRTTPLSGYAHRRPPCRSNQKLIDLYWIRIVHSSKHFSDNFRMLHFLGLGLQRYEEMGCPCVDFVLSDDCAAHACFWVCEEDVPELAVFVETS